MKLAYPSYDIAYVHNKDYATAFVEGQKKMFVLSAKLPVNEKLSTAVGAAVHFELFNASLRP